MQTIMVDVDQDELISVLIRENTTEELIEFITKLDDEVAILSFTRTLADKFQAIVDHEESLDG